MRNLNIAAFGGFRSIPPSNGGAGSDKFALELYPRFIKAGHNVNAYCRKYPGDTGDQLDEYSGVALKWHSTTSRSGFDSLLHSFKATLHIIFKSKADLVHIHSGANSIWAILLRIAGKKTIVSQFAMDWKRDKWPWYGKMFYLLSIYMTAYFPNKVVFDNIYTKEYFEKKFKKKYDFIPYGCEVDKPVKDNQVLKRLGLKTGNYFLFVGRFIPDKGVHLLIEAFQNLKTDKKLVLIGGSPNPDKYEQSIKSVIDERIIFPGYIYGEDTNYLIENAYAYVQPSLIEGLSPVILTVMGLGTPLICSNIKENIYITKDNAVNFISGDSGSLLDALKFSLINREILLSNAKKGSLDVLNRFSWDSVANSFIDIFLELMSE